jgi:hypothetical protein
MVLRGVEQIWMRSQGIHGRVAKCSGKADILWR